MSGFRPTFRQLAPVLDALRAQRGDAKSREVGRTIVAAGRRFLEDGGYSRFDGPFQEAMEELEAAVAPFDELDRKKADRRRLERELESVKTERNRLRRERAKRTVDDAIRQGRAASSDRDGLIRALEADDVNVRAWIDPYFKLQLSDEEFARHFEADFKESPIVPPAPKTPEEAQLVALAADLGLRPEDVI